MIDFIKQIADLSLWELTIFIVCVILFLYVFNTIVDLIKGKSSEPNSKSDENKTDK